MPEDLQATWTSGSVYAEQRQLSPASTVKAKVETAPGVTYEKVDCHEHASIDNLGPASAIDRIS